EVFFIISGTFSDSCCRASKLSLCGNLKFGGVQPKSPRDDLTTHRINLPVDCPLREHRPSWGVFESTDYIAIGLFRPERQINCANNLWKINIGGTPLHGTQMFTAWSCW